jgi:3'-phosphoadenosine 5'-phosphosulfate (PAPS) 3'-phosphatase
MKSNHELLSKMKEATLNASKYILKYIRSKEKSLKTWHKENGSLVTNLDIECEAVLLETLQSVLPVVSEETAESHALIGQTDQYYTIDPIDGTTACKRFLNERGGQVGFGPLVGLIHHGKLIAAAYFNIPKRSLYFALKGEGCYRYTIQNDEELMNGNLSADSITVTNSEQLFNAKKITLAESAALFYVGYNNEAYIVERLKREGIIENVYRFGGFANDATRLAEGSEEIQIQFSVKLWDFAAVLFPLEAGYSALVEPVHTEKNQRKFFDEYIVKKENPVIITLSHNLELLAQEVEKCLQYKF